MAERDLSRYRIMASYVLKWCIICVSLSSHRPLHILYLGNGRTITPCTIPRIREGSSITENMGTGGQQNDGGGGGGGAGEVLPLQKGGLGWETFSPSLRADTKCFGVV